MASNAAINLLTWAQQIAPTNSQEIGWVKSIILGQRGESNPLYDCIGGIGDMKPVLEVMDFSKLQGDTIVFTLDRPLGGAGVQGPGSTNTLAGNEETVLQATYTAQVGLFAHAVSGGATPILRTQTVIGSDWDNRQRKKLKEYFAWKQADDIQFEMVKRAHSRNTVYANGKTSRDQLGSADIFTLSDVPIVKQMLGANQAAPFNITKDPKTKERIFKYLIIGSDSGFSGMAASNSYQNLLIGAGERGDNNKLFKGGLPEYFGTLLHSWTVEDGTQVGPKAALVAPKAFLGVAQAATSTTTVADIVAHATNTTSLFFQYFSNAQYKGHEGEKIAAVTDVTRYIAVKVISGADAGKIALFSYTTNNGNKLTGLKRLGAADAGADILDDIGDVHYGSGVWTSDVVSTGILPVGSIIYEVNSKGQPFTRQYALGRHAIVAGWGALAPTEGGRVPGRRLIQMQDYDRVSGLGWEQVWGCRASENADNMVNGYVLIESAYNPPGWPDIA